jgi:hypothetical protein
LADHLRSAHSSVDAEKYLFSIMVEKVPTVIKICGYCSQTNPHSQQESDGRMIIVVLFARATKYTHNPIVNCLLAN